MILSVLSVFILAIFSPLLFRINPGMAKLVISGFTTLVFLFFIQYLPEISQGTKLHFTHAWVPALGINLNFFLDGLSILFVLMITGIGIIICIYTSSYLKGDHEIGKFFAFLLFFMGSMLGLVLSDNMFTLFIFWELTSLSSYFLIGYKNESKVSRKASLQALLVTGTGGLFLLAGFMMIQSATGVSEISALAGLDGSLRNHAYFPLLTLMILVAAFAKSAQFPFQFWLPSAMAAPTPVSAYLHSATMVKAGVYLLARFTPTLGGSEMWTTGLITIGTITMVYGALTSVFNTDLKKILAYSTISALGLLVLLLGIGTETAVTAAVVFLLIHALYKGALFLIAGAIDHETGSRDITQLTGLFKAMPLIALAGFMAALSNGGIPPFLGFIGKELIYEAGIYGTNWGSFHLLIPGTIIFSKICLIVSGFNAGIRPFVGSPDLSHTRNLKGTILLWIGPLILGCLSLAAGLFPGVIASMFVNSALVSITHVESAVQLHLWHGFNTVFLLSAGSVLAGVIVYQFRIYMLASSKSIQNISVLNTANIYIASMSFLRIFSRVFTRLVQNGYLRFYIITVIIFLTGMVFWTFFVREELLLPSLSIDHFSLTDLVAVIMIAFTTLIAIITTSRLAAVAALGIAGIGIAIIFMSYGAPDLAMTQFTIDTLTVILFVFVLYKLPRFFNMSGTLTHVRDIVISIMFGSMVFILVLYITNNPAESELSNYFVANSYLLAKGKNIVNVILVDFRGLDTMIEITVLAVSSVGVYALLKFKKNESKDA